MKLPWRYLNLRWCTADAGADGNYLRSTCSVECVGLRFGRPFLIRTGLASGFSRCRRRQRLCRLICTALLGPGEERDRKEPDNVGS